MYRVKMLKGNETVIIDNGRSYLFGLNGVCYNEDAGLAGYADGAVDLPIISLLTSGSNLDIGVVLPGCDLKRYRSGLDSMTCAATLQMAGGFLKMLRRSGTDDGVRYNQLLFVYRQNTDMAALLQRLQLQEV